VFARAIHSTNENAFGEAIIASAFPSPEVLVHTRVTLFGRRPIGLRSRHWASEGLAFRLRTLRHRLIRVSSGLPTTETRMINDALR
jgi:hypothetical protein